MINFLKSISETAPNSISSVLVKCTKTEKFSDRGSNFASVFRAVKHVRMLLIIFL